MRDPSTGKERKEISRFLKDFTIPAMRFLFKFAILVSLYIGASATAVYAYIGPGAGFAFVSSFLIFFVTGILALLTIITWPVRAVLILIKRRKAGGHSQVKRIVVVGLDGFDPSLAKRFMREGKLPHFLDLARQGTFRALRTTTPAMSPVAWSSFSTGVNPGKHSIFDFYTRDPKNYMPVLSSAAIFSSKKFFKIGPFQIPLKSAHAKFLRKSISFWKILGDHGIFSTILRVPITFPPEKFYGACLSAMCTPDLLGTQGTFTLFTTEDPQSLEKATNGINVHFNVEENRFTTRILGPSIGGNGSKSTLTIPVSGQVDYEKRSVRLSVGDSTFQLAEGHYSPWIRLKFRTGLTRRISGIARFLVTEMDPHLKIYMTPINIDPEKPPLPISHPVFYSAILSKLRGPFASLGLAEDTWALNARVIDEGAFLEQAYDIYEERKRQLRDALRKNPEGLVVGVFDTTDRIQHMFFRYLTPDHPANRDKDASLYKDAIDQLYQKMDALIGEIREALNENDLLIIVSDHGFKPFKWGVNLNSWLWKEGYLALKEDADLNAEWFAHVDWSRTKAYALGLTGIFLNVRGRERFGIVKPGEERLALQYELREKLEDIWDARNKLKPIRRVILPQEALKGPYLNEAPDLFIGYEEGYRVSWNSAIGKIADQIIEENTRSWSGDHSIDPDLVPGVFFSNWKLEDKMPAIEDLAPTILDLFGLERVGFHDGKILKIFPSNGKDAEK